jgi:DNA-binding transcriptional ArsR family regulator
VKKGLTTLCYGFFSTLANPTRLAIIELLYERPMSVSEMVETIGEEQSMISHNLRPLVRCHFVTRERKGKNNVYSLNHDTMDPVIKAVESHAQDFCGNGANCYLQQDEAN